MSLEHFERMHYDGATIPSEPMAVFLYPWSKDQRSAVQSDGVATTAIKDVADQLLDYGAIDYYEIYRWKYERSDTNYPEWGDIDNCTYDDIKNNFKSFVENNGDTSDYCGTVSKNGTGHSHYDYVGVHQLIHGGYTGCNETEGYAPAGAGAEPWGQTAFNEGRVAWSPVCSDTGLTEAAAAQETLHLFMDPNYDGTNECDSDPRQHSLGTLHFYPDFDYDVCTPMLAYHWDDFEDSNEDPYCPCPVDRESAAESHTTSITSCTKDAVKNTADKLL